MKGAHSLADDHTNRSGTGLFIRFGGHGPVSELPDLEHRRYDHRRLFCPWGGGLCHAGRRGTPDPSHSCRHAGGGCAGFVTAFLQTRLGIPSILAGIVTNTGLYTVNLMAMGWKANQSLLGGSTIFTLLRDSGIGGDWYELLLVASVTILAGVLLLAFLKTRMGLSIRATGDNPDMVRASSLNPAFTVTVGLCVSNALTALSGAMVGQYQKTVDINSGTGIVVIGLACLIIGETVLGRRTVTKGVLAVMIGSVIYRFIYAVVFYTKVVPVECLKLLTAVIVALAIAAPSIRKWAAFQQRKLAAGKGGN